MIKCLSGGHRAHWVVEDGQEGVLVMDYVRVRMSGWGVSEATTVVLLNKGGSRRSVVVGKARDGGARWWFWVEGRWGVGFSSGFCGSRELHKSGLLVSTSWVILVSKGMSILSREFSKLSQWLPRIPIDHKEGQFQIWTCIENNNDVHITNIFLDNQIHQTIKRKPRESLLN